MHLHDQRTIIRPVLLIFGFRPFRYIYFIGNQIPTAGFREDASRTALQHRERAGRNIVEQNGNLLQGHLIPGTPRIEGLIADTLNTLSDNDRFQCGALRKRFRGNLGNSIADISLLQTRTIIEGPFADIGYLVRNDDTFQGAAIVERIILDLFQAFRKLDGRQRRTSVESIQIDLGQVVPLEYYAGQGRAILKSTSAAGFIPQIASHLDNARRNNDFLQPRLSRKAASVI